MSAFGILLRELMDERQFTVRSFADAVKRGKSSINGIIQGSRTPPFDAVEVWSEVLGLKGEARRRFNDLAALAHLPESARGRFEAWYDEHQALKADHAVHSRVVRGQRKDAEGGAS